jgi:uncharacterized membrane protein
MKFFGRNKLVNFNKNGLDEMQKARRDKIGNQSFNLLFYLLMLDIGLYGFGLRWLSYPADVMMIITVCMTVYLVRIIAGDSLISPKAQKSKPVMHIALIVVFSMILAALAVFFGRNLFVQPAVGVNDNSAVILVISSAVGLVIALVFLVIKKISGKDENDRN